MNFNEVRTGLNHVQGMAFGGDEDKYLVVGGVEGGGVKVFERAIRRTRRNREA
ncbi:uncharacterized protein EDB93DRAFT_1076435 [Suillus bovinus]|uniref:uncharacterized protein n=1 Tax=Suillus bovinus TaxID=48563 RepID=UPI001B8718B2|nr:uncharacterized protein EDB93DRAFT_1076435 [Suillus bovinus]KAG2158683.1 hypothetical protein EDB93DRAFT_1076435 [Suillus bovinus]